MTNNEQPESLLLLYSKYSAECKKILNLLPQLPREILTQIKPICIDNKNIRNQLVCSIDITSVPCMMVVYKNKTFEKFDIGITEWILERVQKEPSALSTPISTPITTPEPVPEVPISTPPVPVSTPLSTPLPPSQTPITSLEMMEELGTEPAKPKTKTAADIAREMEAERNRSIPEWDPRRGGPPPK